jgi:hypothetical protein
MGGKKNKKNEGDESVADSLAPESKDAVLPTENVAAGLATRSEENNVMPTGMKSAKSNRKHKPKKQKANQMYESEYDKEPKEHGEVKIEVKEEVKMSGSEEEDHKDGYADVPGLVKLEVKMEGDEIENNGPVVQIDDTDDSNSGSADEI